jgi:CysZ protein
VRDFIKGVRFFLRGVTIMLRSPRLLLIGAAPAVVTALLLLGGMVALIVWLDDLSAFITPFADDWAEGLRTAVRVAVSVALIGAWLVFSMIGFSALTLAVGGPFYEHIAEKVEDDLFSAPAPSGSATSSGSATAGEVVAAPAQTDLSWGRMLWLGIRDGIVLVLRSLMFTIPLVIAGFVPVVGQTVVPVLMVFVTGWFLALELVAVSFYRVGMDLGQRREILSRRRGLALGLGVPTALLCVIPLAAIVVMPFAFVGGVLVAHEVLNNPRR